MKNQEGVFVITTVLLLLAAPVQAERVFTWVDENGVTHFSSTRPAPTEPAADVRATTVEPLNVVDTPNFNARLNALNKTRNNRASGRSGNSSRKRVRRLTKRAQPSCRRARRRR